MFDIARSNLTILFREQLLLLGAVGLAIGVGIAASLPSTELEIEYFGETSDQKDQAQEFASDQAKTMAGQAIRVPTEEANREGLDPDWLRSTAADVGATIKAVVCGTADDIKERMKQS